VDRAGVMIQDVLLPGYASEWETSRKVCFLPLLRQACCLDALLLPPPPCSPPSPFGHRWLSGTALQVCVLRLHRVHRTVPARWLV
jgi:hypothetical protein